MKFKENAWLPGNPSTRRTVCATGTLYLPGHALLSSLTPSCKARPPRHAAVNPLTTHCLRAACPMDSVMSRIQGCAASAAAICSITGEVMFRTRTHNPAHFQLYIKRNKKT